MCCMTSTCQMSGIERSPSRMPGTNRPSNSIVPRRKCSEKLGTFAVRTAHYVCATHPMLAVAVSTTLLAVGPEQSRIGMQDVNGHVSVS